MSQEKKFYKSLGYELMNELAASCVDAKWSSGGLYGAYQVLTLSDELQVRFTSWRDGEGPFYIILFKSAKYVFELDLSMIVYRQDRVSWHLKVPSHSKNVSLLREFLGNSVSFSSEYSNQVKEVKKLIQSGVNTPRTGYSFLEDADWSEVCDRFRELMRRAISVHTAGENSKDVLLEAKNDDGGKNLVAKKTRRSQSRFRLNMISLYGSACAISRESVVEVLEAAHIMGHSETGINHSGNGLLLRSDLHRLFDANLIAIDPRLLTIVISPLLEGTKYTKFAGRKLQSRKDGSRPDLKHLEDRWRQSGFAS